MRTRTRLVAASVTFSLVTLAWAAEPMMDSQMLPGARQATINFMWIGRFADATHQAEKALLLAQQQYGSLHPLTVPLLNDLGTLYRCQALYAKAMEKFEWGLAIRENALGLEDPTLAESLGLMAGLNVDLGRYSLALSQYKRALKIQEKIIQKDPTLVAAILQQMGLVYLLMGDSGKARTSLERCLLIRERAWGTQSVFLVEGLELMARVDQTQGKFGPAEEGLKRCLAIQRKNFPAERLEVLDSTDRLAAFYWAQGRKDDAKGLYEMSEKVRDTFLSSDTYTNLPVLQAAAAADLALGRLKSAGALLTRILKLRKAIYGPDHPLVAFSYEDLASLEETEGQKAKAIGHLKEAKVLLEKVFDPGHPELEAVEKRLEKLSN